VDDQLWEIFKEKYPNQASSMIESFMEKSINVTDEEAELVKELSELQRKADIVETKLCRIRQQKQDKKTAQEKAVETGEVYDELLDDVEWRYHQDHIIGRNFLKRIAKAKGVDADVLERMVEDAGIEVSEYEMGLKESNIKTPLH
jgi:hypothetical protein